MIKPSFGNRVDALSSITSNIMNMFEGGRTNDNEEIDDEEFDDDEEIDDEEIDDEESVVAADTNTAEVKRNNRVVVPVRNGNVTVVVPTDKEEKRNLINKINDLLPRTTDKAATEKLNTHTIEELEVFYKQLQVKADALSEEGEFDLD